MLRFLQVLLLTILPLSLTAEERGPVYFAVDVEPGRWQALEVKNLPAGVKLSVNIKSEGSVMAALIDSEDLARYPRVDNPLFVGRVNRSLDFSVRIPEFDHYYVVVFNDSEQEIQKVELVVSAEIDPDSATRAE